MSANAYPSLDEIYRTTQAYVECHPAIARLESLGASPEGREVPAVLVTDAALPDADKEVALVVCGRHGSELGTRVVGGALRAGLPPPRESAAGVLPPQRPGREACNLDGRLLHVRVRGDLIPAG